jgi:hypothetical protein
MAENSAYLMNRELPRNATHYERTLASMVERLMGLGFPIRDLWNPEKCPEEFLPYLAWSFSVDIWNEAWPTEKKRDVIANSVSDHKIKGTEALHHRYIDYAGSKLISAITPPQAFFAGADDDGPEQQAWLKSLPELRIRTLTESGIAINLLVSGGEDSVLPAEASLGASGSSSSESDDVATWFAGGTVELNDRLDGSFIEDGVTTKVTVTTREDPRRGKRGKVFDAAFNGDAALGYFADDTSSVDFFLQGSIEGQTVTIKYIAGENDGGNWNLFGLEKTTVQDVAPEKVVIPGATQVDVFADGAFEGLYVDAEDPEMQFYYSFRAYRGSVKSPSASFVDFDRLSMKPFTAELLVQVKEKAVTDGFYVGGFANAHYALPKADLSKLWAAMDASTSAKALRDTILFDLDLDSNKTLRKSRSLRTLTF